jgi:CheB methylesterase
MVASQEDGGVVLKTLQGPKENFCRPSVDVLFHSIARVYGARALAVVLTGLGQDGLKGCETLRSLGARIYVQDEAGSVVRGMPGFVAKGGPADKILPLDQMGVGLFVPLSCRAPREINPEILVSPAEQSILGQAIEIAIVVEGGCLLHELENLEHAFAAFPVHFAELNGDAGAGIKSGHHAFR